MPEQTKWRSLLIGVAIIAAAVSAFLYLTFTRTIPDRKSRPSDAQIVNIVRASVASLPIVIKAMGGVQPAQSVQVIPQVNGQVVYLSPNLIPGTFVKAGEVLLRIEPKDYDIALREAQAAVSQAQLSLEEQEAAKAAAERELELVGDELTLTEQGRRLANRDMYVENARMQLDAAQSRLEQAKLALSRTVVRAPFDAQVSGKTVEVGQLVSTQTPVATLVSGNAAWIEASLPVESLRWFDIPGVNSETGASVTIRQRLGGDSEITRQGRVLRLFPELQDQGKLARVLIEVPNPFGNASGSKQEDEKSEENELPLLMGAFVHVEIIGHIIPDLIAVPRLALREDDEVWVRDSEGRLAIRKVEVVWSSDQTLYLKGELKEGEDVITSRIANPIPGMEISTEIPANSDAKPDQKDTAEQTPTVQPAGARP